jgi:hypothetical protein
VQYGVVTRVTQCRDEGRSGLVVWEQWGSQCWLLVYYAGEGGWEVQLRYVLFEPIGGLLAHVL